MKKDVYSQDFVVLENKTFFLNHQGWYPMIINYSIDLRVAQNYDNPGPEDYFVTPRADYHPNFPNTYSPWSNNPNSGVDFGPNAIKAHLQKIKNMGFNTIRLTGFTAVANQNNELVDYSNRNILTTFGLSNDGYNNYFAYIESVIEVAECVGLKVILLTGGGWANNGGGVENAGYQYSVFLAELALYFKENSTIIAYDLYNEPLYHEMYIRSKEDIHSLVHCWNASIKVNAPKHLTTIGITSYTDVFGWDADLLHVDFLSFHFYPNQGSEAIERNLKWIAEEVSVPWIVGETGIATQSGIVLREFNLDLMYKVRNAGGSGYTLWTFQDYSRPTCNAECYYGLISSEFATQSIASTCFGSLIMYGVDKNPLIYNDISTFMENPYSTTSPISPSIVNYSDLGSGNLLLTGIIKSWNIGNPPIRNAVIRYYNSSGIHYFFTDNNGAFAFRSESIGGLVSAYGHENISLANVLAFISYNWQLGYVVTFEDIYLYDISSVHQDNVWVQAGQSYYASGLKNLHAHDVNVFANNNSAKLEAGEMIKLHPGFEAKLGSVFIAQILPTVHCVIDYRMESNSVYQENILVKEYQWESESINDSGIVDDIIIYPNPTDGQFTLDLENIIDKHDVLVEIISSVGNVIYQKRILENNVKVFDIGNFSSGIYLVKVTSMNDVRVKKIIKK